MIQGIIVTNMMVLKIDDNSSPVHPAHIDRHVNGITVERLAQGSGKIVLNICIVESVIGVN